MQVLVDQFFAMRAGYQGVCTVCLRVRVTAFADSFQQLRLAGNRARKVSVDALFGKARAASSVHGGHATRRLSVCQQRQGAEAGAPLHRHQPRRLSRRAAAAAALAHAAPRGLAFARTDPPRRHGELGCCGRPCALAINRAHRIVNGNHFLQKTTVYCGLGKPASRGCAKIASPS